MNTDARLGNAKGLARGLGLGEPQWPTALLGFGVLMAVGLAVGGSSLGYYWNWDGLHLVREYTNAELAGVWVGNWDPDGLESSGLRPLSTLFNHFRAFLLGESLAAHRIFLLTLYSLFLSLLGSALSRCGISPWVGVLAGVLTLCSKNSYYHFLWVSDGVHVLQGVFFALALHAILSQMERGGGLWMALAVLLAALCLLVREDSLAVYPALVLVPAWYAHDAGILSRRWRSILLYALLLLGFAGIFWIWRSAAVAEAVGVQPNPGFLWRYARGLKWSISYTGETPIQLQIFVACFVGLFAAVIFLSRGRERSIALLWLALMLFSASPALIDVRPNLLLFPVAFYAVFVALGLSAVSRSSPALRVVAILFLGFAVFAGSSASRLEQRSMHPMSSGQIFRNWEFVFGEMREAATIPPLRIEHLEAQFASLGVGPDLEYAKWRRRLIREGRVGFERNGQIFVPRRRFLSH